MKKIFTKSGTLLGVALLLASGCTDRFNEINTNPTTYSQSSFDANYLLTQEQLTYTGSTDFAYETWRGNLIYCSGIVQGFSTVLSYWAGDKYLLNESFTGAYWERAYSEQMKAATDLVAITDGRAQYKKPAPDCPHHARARGRAHHRPLRRRALLARRPGLLHGRYHAGV